VFGYLITDPTYYQDTRFFHILELALLKHRPKFVCFRDKQNTPSKTKLLNFVQLCHKYSVSPIINSNLELAKEISFDGVHLTSSQHTLIQDVKNCNMKCIVSCHTQNEVATCLKNGADFVTLSPVFNSPNKSAPLGINLFASMIEGFEGRVIALGGIINKKEIAELEKLNIAGFASIRYFIND
jgi:thiamine-phosphate pyrophosphorylase